MVAVQESAVASGNQLEGLEEDSENYEPLWTQSTQMQEGYKAPKRLPKILRTSRRKRQEVSLREVCKSIPSIDNSLAYQLPGKLVPKEVKGKGGYADVRIGEWFPPGSTRPMVVAIKYPRPVRLNDLEENEMLQVLLKVSNAFN